MQPRSHTERLREESRRTDRDFHRDPHRRHAPIYNPHTTLGAVGHWIRTASLLSPLVIGEFIKDPDRRWKAIRLVSVATTLLSEGLYTHRVRKERDHARELEAELQI